MTWISPTYDADLNLLYVGTGNPQPVMAAKTREGANLFTESIVALNADSGKMAWYFSLLHTTRTTGMQWKRRCCLTARSTANSAAVGAGSRNGGCFVLDRETGTELRQRALYKDQLDQRPGCQGQPIPDPAKEPQMQARWFRRMRKAESIGLLRRTASYRMFYVNATTFVCPFTTF